MSRLLWHSTAPWSGTGYGQQTKLFTPRIRDLGHEVAISAYWGLDGAVIGWEGMNVYPGDEQWGNRSLPLYTQLHKADLVVTLMDVWVLTSKRLKDLPLACWVPVDHEPAPPRVLQFFERTGAKPIAMSRFGERMLNDAGLEPLYVPHGCFDYDARVGLTCGETAKLGDIVTGSKAVDSVLGVDTTGKPCEARILDRHRLPLRDSHALSVVTRSGRTMVITRDNEVLTDRGWCRAGALRDTDVVATVDVHGRSRLESRGDRLAGGSLRHGHQGGHPGAVSQSHMGGHPAVREQEIRPSSTRVECLCADAHNAERTDAGGMGVLRWSDRRRRPHQPDPHQEAQRLHALHAESRSDESIGSADRMGRCPDCLDRAVGRSGQGSMGLGIPPSDHGASRGQPTPAPLALSRDQKMPSRAAVGILRGSSDSSIQLARGRTGRAHLSADEKPEWPEALTFEPIVSITPVWLEEVYDLTTSTGTFVVDGIVVHNCDTSVMRPRPEKRAETREQLGVPEDAFVVGMVAANQGNTPPRKAFPQVFQAFARLHERHPDAYLFLHSDPQGGGVKQGVNLPGLAEACGLPEESVRFTGSVQYELGMQPLDMSRLYSAFDVLANPSYGEGFGVPILEAQSCGTRVLVNDCTSMSELVGDGWAVKGDPWYDALQQAFWQCPSISEIDDALEEAYELRHDGPSEQAREFALGYDADRVTSKYWVPALARMGVSRSLALA